MTTTIYESAWDLLDKQLHREMKLVWNPSGPVILAVDSEKGGVGKSALSAGLVAVMAANGKRVLAVDLDPRASLTEQLDATEGEFSVNDLLYVDTAADPDELPELSGLAAQALRDAGEEWGPNVKVLAADRALGNREHDNTPNLEHRLRVSLEGVAEEFDLVVIDFPPRPGGKLVASGLLAATHVLYPGTLTEDGYVGIADALRTRRFMDQANPRKLIDVGMVRNIVDRKTRVAQLIEDKFREDFKDRVLPVVVPKRVIREEARLARVPITAAQGKDAQELVNAYTGVLNFVGKAA
ncbi:ParA family protein [Saccharothrix sp. HUAS TT1]|uniref:ParA family protein n=1 Tax=unclassified Saccharothrix TaxID=2593673 RepID=UPI00345BD110